MTTTTHPSLFVARVLVFTFFLSTAKSSIKVQLDSGLESGLFLEVPEEEQDDQFHESSSEVTRFFTLLQPKKEVSVRASFGPISVRETIYPQKEALKQLDEFESNSNTDAANKPVKLYHNEHNSDFDLDEAHLKNQSSKVIFSRPVILTLPAQSFDVSGHLVKKEITRNNPVVQVLFYAGHSHHHHQHLPQTFHPKSPFSYPDSPDESLNLENESNEPDLINTAGSSNLLCAVVIVSKDEEKVFGACSPSFSPEGSCLASVTLPSSWWPSVMFNYTNKRYKPVAASVDYILVKDPACTESSLGMIPSVPDHLIRSIESLSDLINPFPIGSVNQLEGVKLSLFKGTHEEVTNDNMIKILIPQEPTYPNARIYIPVTYKANPNHPVAAFSVRVKIKSGVRVLAAQVSPTSQWQIFFESSSKGNVATVTCFLRDQDLQMNDASFGRKNSNRGQGFKSSKLSGSAAQEVFSFLLEVDHRADVSDNDGRIVWQLLYITDIASNTFSTAPMAKGQRKEQTSSSIKESGSTRKEFLERESLKLTSKLDIEKDEVSSIIGVSKSNQMLNTAILTGKQISQPLKVFVVSKSGRSGDVTLQSTCHSLDESSLKVSQSCTSVYFDGSELRPSVNSTIIIKYGSFTGYCSFVVWMPKIPLEIKVGDSKLSQIRGWRIPHHHGEKQGDDLMKSVMKNRKKKRSNREGMNWEKNSNHGHGEEKGEHVRMSADDDNGHVQSADFNNLDSVYNSKRFTESNNSLHGVDLLKRKGVMEGSKRQVSPMIDRSESNQHDTSSSSKYEVLQGKESNHFDSLKSSVTKKKTTSNNPAKNSGIKTVGIGTQANGDESGTMITSSGNEDNCRLRYQQTKVKVLTKFYTNDHESGRETYLSSRGNVFDVTSLVASNIRILDPRILSFRPSDLVIDGLSPGKTQVLVMSPITGRTLGAAEIKVATDRETITHLDISLVTGLNLQIFPYSDFTDNIWAARVMTTDRFSSLYQEGLFYIKLYFSDGTVMPLDLISSQDYHLSIDIFHENRAIAMAPSSLSASSNSYPRIISINEGKDQLIHLSLEIPQVCQRKRTQQLAMSYLTINVDFDAGDESSSLINLQQNDAFSKLKSKLNRSRNSPLRPNSLFSSSSGSSYSSYSPSGSSSSTSRNPNTGSSFSSSNKDFNYHRERILKMILAKPESEDSIRVVNADFDPGLYYNNLTPLEIGMYSLLLIFSLAVLIFIFSCLIFASKFRIKNNSYTLPHYLPTRHVPSVVTSVAHLPADHPHQLISNPNSVDDSRIRGRDMHKNVDLSNILRKPLLDHSLGRDAKDNDWVFLNRPALEKELASAQAHHSRNSNPLVNESNLMSLKTSSLVCVSRTGEEDSRSSRASDPIVVKPNKKCDTRRFHSDDVFDTRTRPKRDRYCELDANVGLEYKLSSSLLYPEESEESIHITANPFHFEEQNLSDCTPRPDILSIDSSELSDRENQSWFQSSSDEEYRGRQNCSSEGSLKLTAISRLRKKAKAKDRSKKNKTHFKVSACPRYHSKINESLLTSAVPPPIPARRTTIGRPSHPPQIPEHIPKNDDQSRAQSSCGSDGEYLYGVVIKDKKKGKKVQQQSSTESEGPSSSSVFGPPTSTCITSDDGNKSEEKTCENVDGKIRHPQATCSSAPDVPDHGPKCKNDNDPVSEQEGKSEEAKSANAEKVILPLPPPIPLHAPRRPAHRVNYSRTSGKMSSKPPPVPAHSDTMKLSSSPSNKPLPPSPSRKEREDKTTTSPHLIPGTSFSNRSRSHSRPKSLSLKHTFQGGLSLVPHPHLPTRRVDSRNIDKEWEQATKGMNYNQLMEYFNALKESSA